jgi:hypothetical protein
MLRLKRLRRDGACSPVPNVFPSPADPMSQPQSRNVPDGAHAASRAGLSLKEP